jgi:hypothetical protein
MDASERTQVLRDVDHVPECGTTPSVCLVFQEPRPVGQTPPRDPPGSCAPGQCASESFVGGAGI